MQTKATVPGQKIALSGYYFSGGSQERIEAGFSFWDAAGNWITDRTLILASSTSYRGFVVDTVVPEGALTMSIWGWCGAGGNATFDDLALFRSDQTDENLFSDGGFEGGTLAPWGTGGTNVTLTAASRSGIGTGAVLIGAESFIVHHRAVTAGEKLDFTGFARAGGNATAPREAGIFYWNAGGASLGDELVPLVFSSSYTAFTVNGTAPAGAVACSVWVWSGPGGTLTGDDLRLVRPVAIEAGLNGVSGSVEELERGSRMANLTLKSGRTLDLSGNGTLQEDPLLAFAIG